jgi:Ca2+-binding RTX toxin-like protein
VVTTSGANPPANPGKNYLSGDIGKDLIFGIGDRDSLFGGEDVDTLIMLGNIVAETNNNTSIQGANDDSLDGVPQNAYMDGGAANDSLIAFGGERGRNTLLGGEGNDTIRNYGDESYVAGGAGNDTLLMEAGLGTFDGSTLLGGEGDDSINVSGSGGTNLIYGDVGADTIVGSNTATAAGQGDTIYGGDAANTDTSGDSINGGAFSYVFAQQGNDTVVGIGANASLYGGQGGDSMVAAGTSYLSGDLGSDTLNVNATQGNRLYGGDGNDSLYGVGGSQNSLVGGLGNDILVAGAADDTLIGGEGDDFFVGTDNAETLGGAETRVGSDTLYGDGGADTLVGTSGLFDGFYYANSDEIGDSITAFESGTDKIYLRSTAFGNIDAAGATVANLAAPGQNLRTNLDFLSTNQDYTTTLQGTFSGGSTTLPAIVFQDTGAGGVLYWDINGGGNTNTAVGGGTLSVIATIGTGSVNVNDIVIF